MTRIIESLGDVAGDYDALYCDLWGCYHNGLAPYPAAVAALRAFRAAGKTVILFTNAPRSADQVAGHLARMGAPTDTHDAIVSSGDAARAEVASHRFGRRVHYLGPERDLSFFDGADVEIVPAEEAESVIAIGLRDDSFETPAHYADDIALWKARGLPMLCANPDLIVDRGDTRLYCAGAIAAAYEAAGGAVTHSGKPHAPIYRLGAARLNALRGAGPHRVLVVGDGIRTDVLGGVNEGVDSVFLAGGIAHDVIGGDPERPDPEAVASFIAAEGVTPTYAMGRLR